MAEINWDKLVIEGRAIARGVPLPEGITHISQMEVEVLDSDSTTEVPEMTKKEIMAILEEKGIEFKPTMNKTDLLALIPADEDALPLVAPVDEDTTVTGNISTIPTDTNDSDTL